MRSQDWIFFLLYHVLTKVITRPYIKGGSQNGTPFSRDELVPKMWLCEL